MEGVDGVSAETLLGLDDGQLALRDTTRAFCTRHHDLATIARREGRPADAATWKGLADLGVFTMLGEGGAGDLDAHAVETALVFEQLGAHLVTGPALWTTIATPLLDDVDGAAERITGIDVTSTDRPPFVVAHTAESSVLVVLRADGVERCAVSDLGETTATVPLDPTTPITVHDALPKGVTVGGPDEARRLRLVGALLAAAQLVGAAQGALDVAAAYALERHQFGVPIGSFQAVKHLLADMYVRTELARSATCSAAAVVAGADDATAAVSAAKVLAGDAGIANGHAAVQVLGGMGFTWQMTPHYFLKRAWVLEDAFGSGDSHAFDLGGSVASELEQTSTGAA